MSDSFSLVLAVGGGWLVIGLVLAVVMGRRGHSGFAWLVLGSVMGPIGVVMAFDAGRHEEAIGATTLAGDTGVAGNGPVDVLIGYDGTPRSATAIDAVVALLGPRLGRLTVASVVAYGDVGRPRELAEEGLRRLAADRPDQTLVLELLHGHPSVALGAFAAAGNYALIAVGTRGKGMSKAVLGSAASELARESTVPVLLVGDRVSPRADVIGPPLHATADEPRASRYFVAEATAGEHGSRSRRRSVPST